MNFWFVSLPVLGDGEALAGDLVNDGLRVLVVHPPLVALQFLVESIFRKRNFLIFLKIFTARLGLSVRISQLYFQKIKISRSISH